MKILAAIGWLLLLAGAAALIKGIIGAGGGGGAWQIAAGQLWFELHPTSLQLAQPAIQRYLHPMIWDPVVQTILLWPAWLVLGAPGAALLAIVRFTGRTRRRRGG